MVDHSLQEQAQDLAFDAMEAPTRAKALKLAKEALAIDPDCVDAIALTASLQAKTPKGMIAGMEKAVAAGERSLGPAFFAENTGQFWHLIETRPYMRARELLAAMLKDEERYSEAADHYAALVKLNPNDNQGARYPLLCLYLALNKLPEAAELIQTYKDDTAPIFLWCRVLERLLWGDLVQASAALNTARQQNPFVEGYLTGALPFPTELPGLYSPGSNEEAVLCLAEIGIAWAEHTDATMWLLASLLADKHAKPPGRKTRCRAPARTSTRT